MNKDIKLEYFVERNVEKYLSEKGKYQDFLDNLDSAKFDLYDFCKNTDHELLFISSTEEQGFIEPCYVFLSPPDRFSPDGLKAYTLAGIINTLEDIEYDSEF